MGDARDDTLLERLQDAEGELRERVRAAEARAAAAEERCGQMWVALANIRDACGPNSMFRRQAEAAIGTTTDPMDGTPEAIAVGNRRRLAAQRDEARARAALVDRMAEGLRDARSAAQRCDGQLGLGIHREPTVGQEWKDEASELVRLLRQVDIDVRALLAEYDALGETK